MNLDRDPLREAYLLTLLPGRDARADRAADDGAKHGAPGVLAEDATEDCTAGSGSADGGRPLRAIATGAEWRFQNTYPLHSLRCIDDRDRRRFAQEGAFVGRSRPPALARALVESLDGEPDSDVEETWKAETERRAAELDSG